MTEKNDDKIILVDENDNQVGIEGKLKSHLGAGVLHRAFSIFVFNKKGELLLQQRSAEKMLWPLFWSNTCCSHPKEGETWKQAGQRRLEEELGFSCPLEFKGKFQYHAGYKDIGSENELCYVLAGKYEGEVIANKKEVASFKWIDFEAVKEDVAQNSKKYTPWFKIELEKFFNN